MACIYVYRNKMNGKCYVGQTVNSGRDRFRQHKYHKEMPIGHAIRKYGSEAFEVHEFFGVPVHMLDEVEQRMIASLNTVCPNGYNLGLGGQKNRAVSAETGRKLGLANRGKLLSAEHIASIVSANTGRIKSELERMRLSAALSGKPKSYSHRKAISISRKLSGVCKGENNPSARVVACMETGQIFGTMTDAASWCGLKSISNIQLVCNGTNHTAGGYHWKYVQGGI